MYRFLCIVLVGLGLFSAADLSAQIPNRFSPTSAVLTREDLQTLLDQYEAAMASPAYSQELKSAARVEAQRIRERLEQGDFRVGDRVALSVQGEPNLPDTVAVEPGPKITLPLFGEISLDGVLRSELTAHLTTEIGRFIRDPVVQSEGLMRLSIQGTVGNPGFYVVPADMLVSEALMMAGGPGQSANLEKIRIERAGRPLLEGEAMQEAMVEGRTLDQLNLQAGDQIVLPQEERSPLVGMFARYALVIGSVLLFGIRVF